MTARVLQIVFLAGRAYYDSEKPWHSRTFVTGNRANFRVSQSYRYLFESFSKARYNRRALIAKSLYLLFQKRALLNFLN